MKSVSRQLTLGRLLIVGGKGLSLQKRIAAQKADYNATEKRSAQLVANQERISYRDGETRQRHRNDKIDAYGNFEQSHANLPDGIYARMRTPSREVHGPQNQKKPEGVPAHTAIAEVERRRVKKKEQSANPKGDTDPRAVDPNTAKGKSVPKKGEKRSSKGRKGSNGKGKGGGGEGKQGGGIIKGGKTLVQDTPIMAWYAAPPHSKLASPMTDP